MLAPAAAQASYRIRMGECVPDKMTRIHEGCVKLRSRVRIVYVSLCFKWWTISGSSLQATYLNHSLIHIVRLSRMLVTVDPK